MEKMCNKCKILKPINLFYKDASKKDGLATYCKSCKNESINAYATKNKQKVFDFQKNYRDRNKELISKRKKEWYLKNIEHCSERQKNKYAENREHILIKASEYRKLNADEITRYQALSFIKNPNKYKIYKKLNKDKVNNVNQKRRARLKHLEFNYTVEQWTQCKLYFNNECAYCGKGSKLTREHFIPLIKGGEYTANNIIPVCSTCNSSKNDTDFFKWYPKCNLYSKDREIKILKYLNYKNKIQQLALII